MTDATCLGRMKLVVVVVRAESLDRAVVVGKIGVENIVYKPYIQISIHYLTFSRWGFGVLGFWGVFASSCSSC